MNHILFPITYECNLCCKFCSERNKKHIIDIEQSLNEIRKNAGKTTWVYITGGEPFLVEHLPVVCMRLKEHFKVGITTNGTIFRPDIADYADRIGISLDGDKEYHDSYRGNGVFDKALNLFDAIKGKCETVIMSTSFKENAQALINLEPIVEKLDPTYWQIQKTL